MSESIKYFRIAGELKLHYNNQINSFRQETVVNNCVIFEKKTPKIEILTQHNTFPWLT